MTHHHVIPTRPGVVCPPCAPDGSDGPIRPCRRRFPDGADRGSSSRPMRAPIQAWTVTTSTPRASHRQAAVCRRSWIRRPSAVWAQFRVRLNAVACSRCPDSVKNGRSSGSRPSAHARIKTSTRSAIGTRRDLSDLVVLTRTPSGSARSTTSIGSGTWMKFRTRIPATRTSAAQSNRR